MVWFKTHVVTGDVKEMVAEYYLFGFDNAMFVNMLKYFAVYSNIINFVSFDKFPMISLKAKFYNVTKFTWECVSNGAYHPAVIGGGTVIRLSG